MSEKNILSRIQHKHDIEANWIKAVNFIPKKAELIVYDPDENFDYSRAKIGDGIKNVNDLPFMIDKTEVALKTDILSPDLSQNDPEAADYVKGVIRQESLPEGYPYNKVTTTELITWDGNTDGLVTIDVGGMLLYKISNNTPTEDELNGAIMRLSNGTDSVEFECAAHSMSGITGAADSDSKYMLYITYSDNFDLQGFVFPESGTYWSNNVNDNYYLTSVDKVTTEIIPLDEKFTPYVVGKRGTGESSELHNAASEASGRYSHAEGWSTRATETCSHAEGHGTEASGDYSHAEGSYTNATNYCSHAEGSGTRATGQHSHAEGNSTEASGECSHAEGEYSKASGYCSHAEGGEYTIASGKYQHVQGTCKIEDTNNKYLHIVGNGYTDLSTGSVVYNRSNAHTLDWDGNAWFAGDVYVGSTSGTNKDDGSVKLARISDIPEELTEDEVLQSLIECEVIDPVTDENSNILHDQNNTILEY